MLFSLKDAESLCRAVRSRVEQEIPVIHCRLFGSYANNTATEWSDIDLFIELEDVSESIKLRIREIAWEIGLANGAVISTLIASRHEVEDTALRSAPILAAIFEHGLRL